MLVLHSSLYNSPIMSLQSGGQLGTTLDPIIDPRKLQVVAFHVGGPRIHEESVLHTTDIREIGPLGIIINDADEIMPLDGSLIRLQEVINMRFTLVDKVVVDDTRKKLGKVSEYTLETDGFTIQKIHVAQSIMKNITSSSLIINRSQIMEITDKEIIVRSATVQQPTGLGQMLNPFRKTSGSLSSDASLHQKR